MPDLKPASALSPHFSQAAPLLIDTMGRATVNFIINADDDAGHLCPDSARLIIYRFQAHYYLFGQATKRL